MRHWIGSRRSDGGKLAEVWRVLALTTCLAQAMPAIGEPRHCDDPRLMVDTADGALGNALCAMVPGILDDLAACGLAQSQPLTVEVDRSVSHPMGTCLAYFDCDYDVIHVTHPDMFGGLLAAEAPYAALPTEVLLRALLTHELSHALLTQTAAPREVAMVDQEYVAAALELELMTPEWRDVLLAASPVSLPPKEGLIDTLIYGLSPRKFAVNVWQHFSLPENGCSLVQRIAAGEVSFSKDKRPELR